jgi:site-specific DNA recombinase
VRQKIEARVLAALKARILTPEMVEAFVRAYAEELATLQRESITRRVQPEQQVASVERRLQGVLRAVENGAWNESLHTRLTELETQKTTLAAQLASLTDPPAVQLHPNAASLYAANVADLEAALDAPDVRIEAAETLRRLIERVVLTPDPAAPDGLAAELHGDLATILALAVATESGRPGQARRRATAGTLVPKNQVPVVAGIGFEPMTFRL